MNCIYCNNSIVNRTKGDHIISQGLGKFSPDLRVFCICKKCDSQNGNSFERIVMRTGFISFLRSIHGIKSKNNKKMPIHSPSLDKFSAIESEEFALKNMSKPDENIYIDGDGTVRYLNFLQFRKNGKIIKIIEIPVTRNIAEICDFIQANTPKVSDDIECELNISNKNKESVLEELSRRGMKLGESYLKKQEPELTILNISSIITDNHFRFVASTVLKGMIFLGYSTDLLCNIIEYVKSGNNSNLIYRNIDKYESGVDTLDNPLLSIFYHTFEWNITGSSIAITASIFAHRKVNGLRMKLSLKAGHNNSIIIPYGKIIAKYGNTPRDGILEIFHGDHKYERK